MTSYFTNKPLIQFPEQIMKTIRDIISYMYDQTVPVDLDTVYLTNQENQEFMRENLDNFLDISGFLYASKISYKNTLDYDRRNFSNFFKSDLNAFIINTIEDLVYDPTSELFMSQLQIDTLKTPQDFNYNLVVTPCPTIDWPTMLYNFISTGFKFTTHSNQYRYFFGNPKINCNTTGAGCGLTSLWFLGSINFLEYIQMICDSDINVPTKGTRPRLLFRHYAYKTFFHGKTTGTYREMCFKVSDTELLFNYLSDCLNPNNATLLYLTDIAYDTRKISAYGYGHSVVIFKNLNGTLAIIDPYSAKSEYIQTTQNGDWDFEFANLNKYYIPILSGNDIRDFAQIWEHNAISLLVLEIEKPDELKIFTNNRDLHCSCVVPAKMDPPLSLTKAVAIWKEYTSAPKTSLVNRIGKQWLNKTKSKRETIRNLKSRQELLGEIKRQPLITKSSNSVYSFTGRGYTHKRKIKNTQTKKYRQFKQNQKKHNQLKNNLSKTKKNNKFKKYY